MQAYIQAITENYESKFFAIQCLQVPGQYVLFAWSLINWELSKMSCFLFHNAVHLFGSERFHM